jgi:urease beta subunit
MLEKLKHDREGQMSIRINQRYRTCFRWENEDAYEVEIVDYHQIQGTSGSANASGKYLEDKAAQKSSSYTSGGDVA